MGDIIQSSILLKSLKKLYPDSEITYLLLNNFKDTISFIPEIDRVIPVDFSGALKNIDELSLNDAFKDIKILTEQISEEKFSQIINLSFSKLSGYLAYFINSEIKNGLVFGENNEFIATDKWSRFFLSIVEHREFSPFNLVDIYTKIGLNGERVLYEFDAKADEDKKEDKIFGFVMGASTYDRQWPPELFAKTAELILEKYKQSKIFLFGTKEEKHISEKFFSQIKQYENIIDLTGKTNLKDLGKAIDDIDILLTNDTGTMHIGWLKGKKIIELSLGPALYNTTGPYGKGHIILQPEIECAPCNYSTKCKDLKCHRLITPETVLKVIGVINCKNKKIEKIKNVKILESYFDKDGFVDYQYLCNSNGQNVKIRNSLKNIWLKTLENCLKKKGKYIIDINNGLFQTLLSNVRGIIKLIDFAVETVNNKNVEENVNIILKSESQLRELVYSNFSYLVPFWKYLEFTRNLLPDDNLEYSLKSLKGLYEIFYVQIGELNYFQK